MTSTVFLCRASGEGTHDFRVCADEAGVMAFYKEMWGEDHGGGIQSQIDHFRDPDNWGMEGAAYSCELYCSRFEVWKVEANQLSSLPSGVMTKNVPVEPTVEMINAGHLAWVSDRPVGVGPVTAVWEAMLAAAPEAAPHQNASPSPAPVIEEPEWLTGLRVAVQQHNFSSAVIDHRSMEHRREMVQYIDALRSRLVEQGEEIERLKASGDRHFKLRIEAELRADRAESALREAREKERERCAKFVETVKEFRPPEIYLKCDFRMEETADGFWPLNDMEQRLVRAIAQAIRSMTDEQK